MGRRGVWGTNARVRVYEYEDENISDEFGAVVGRTSFYVPAVLR